MKKEKLLIALLVCTTIGLQVNATEVGDWNGIVNGFETGGGYSLSKDITADKIIMSGEDKSNAAYFEANNVSLDLNGYTIFGTNGAEHIDSIFEVGDQLGAAGHNGKKLSIIGGSINGYHNNSPLSGNTPQPSAGTIGVYNSSATKEFNVNFTNNTNDVGGAIANITTNLNEGENSVINSISGKFTNNKANFLGGAIYNAGVEIGNNDERFENYNIIRNLDSQITITTKDNNQTVFSGNSAQIGGAIFNTGTVNIAAKDSNQVIFETASDSIYNNGVLNIVSGVTVVNSNISDNVTNMNIGQFQQSFGGEGVTNIKENATLSLGDGATLTQKEINVDGVLESFGNNAINGALKIGETGIVDINADAFDREVSNNGELSLFDGTLSQNVTGDGWVTVYGDVKNNAKISQGYLAIEPDEDGTLTTNIDNIILSSKEIQNGGNLILTGGTNNYTIKNLREINGEAVTGVGTTIINGDVTNNALISQAINVQSGTLISNADNIGGNLTVNTGATYNIIGGTASDIMTFSNGSTLSLLGNAKDVTIDKLAIASGDVVNLKFDWGDTLNSSSSEVKGNLNVTEINLASTNGTESKYTFTNSLTDKVALDSNITLSNVTDKTNNFVTYNNTNGELFSKRRTLAGAVDETGISKTNTYAMVGNESAGNETLTGSLTVQGNGNSITGGGITVGDGTTTGSVLTLKDVNFDSITVEGDSKGAIHVNGGNELNVIAEAADLTIKGSTGNSSSAIYLQKDNTNGAAKATINAQGGSITISDDIMSNDKDNQVVFTGNKDIKFSGKFDPVLATVNMNGAELERSGQDIDIDWNLNGGTLHYTNDDYLSGGTNSINLNGGSLDLRNGAVNYIDLAGLTLSNNSNLYLDADLANETMDSFNTDNISVANNSAKLHVAGFNLISDATKDKTTINFVPQETGLTGYVDYTGKQGITALSPIYKYNVTYDETKGDFNFTRFAAGGGYKSYNPAVMASPVAAQLGGYLTQLNSYDQAFRNMDMYMLMTKKQREAMKLRNKYAADGNLIFDSTGTPYNNKAVWARPYATFENVSLKGGPKVSNVAYGSFFGGESELYDLGHGWDGMYGFYAGYNGSHQAYDGIGIYQNGGTLGLVGMAYKGNYFVGTTINAGANVGEASTSYGTDNFTMLMAGIAAKTGYNWELADGKFIIQPNFQMSYSFVNTFDYTNAAGVRMDSSPLNAIQFEPGIKFIGNLKNGWQPYAGVSVVWNVMDKTNFHANNVSLPELSIKPYVRYGIGVRKTWGEVCTGFFQTYFTNGGRNGVGLQAGFRFTLGKGGLSSIKSSNKTPELPKTKINLNSAR